MPCRLVHDYRISLPPVMVNLVHHLRVGQALRLGREGLIAVPAAVERTAVGAVVAGGVLLTLPAVRMADEGNADRVVPAVMVELAVVVRVVPDGDTGGGCDGEVLAVN